MGHPCVFFHVCLGFFEQTIQFSQQINEKNVHPVDNTGIRTHDLHNMSLPP